MDDFPVCNNCAYPIFGLFLSGRTNCPFCGMNVTSRNENETNERLRLPRVQQRRRSFSGSLVRLFMTLRRGRRSRSSSTESSLGIPPADDWSHHATNLNKKSHSINNLFPPIKHSSSASRSSKGESSKKHDSRPSLSTRSPPPLYSASQLKKAVSRARSNGKWSEIHNYYLTSFGSFQDMNVAFKFREYSSTSRDSYSTRSGLDLNLIEVCFDQLLCIPTDIQKAVLKSVLNCLLNDQRNFDAIMMRPVLKDDMRVYFLLLQNPQFRKPSTFVVFSHLLRHVATLCEQDHHIISEWFEELSAKQFTKVIESVQQLISIRLFPPKPEDLPPMSKCSWWIPCAVKSLTVLNAANEKAKLVPYTDFYNSALDHWDLMSDYIQWQTPNFNVGFCFCQYPFILSVNAKKLMMEGQAEQQMISTARDSIIGNLATNRAPDVDMLFLNISVRRDHLLQDSLTELSTKHRNMGKKLRVQFQGEPGLDMGGLTKEWFQLLIRKIFQPDYGMFVYYKKSEVYWFNTLMTEMDENLQEYHLVGALMGLAVYNGVILDIRFPLVCYKKLLSPPTVPRIFDIRIPQGLSLGLITGSLSDLAQIAPDVARGLKELLEYDGDVEEDFGLNFQISLQELGIRTVDLKENGHKIPVTNSNRKEYVELYIDWLINEAIDRQFKAFYLGFHSVCNSNLLLLLRPEEIELLVCGNPDFNLKELKNVSTYEGYSAQDKTIRYFWDLVLKLPEKHQKRFLWFVTGSDRIPAGGMKEMSLKISKMVSLFPMMSAEQMLPIAHTCFNHLVLPDYKNRQVLRQKLAIALTHGEGFGLE